MAKQPDCPHGHCIDGQLELHGPELEIVPCPHCTFAHVYHRCERVECDKDCDADGQVHRFGHVSGCAYHSCGGCRQEGMDCMYEALACCAVCDCYEGSLLPFCPGRRVSLGEAELFYAHYCAGTGPFAKATKETVVAARNACWQHLTASTSVGSVQLYSAVAAMMRMVLHEEALGFKA